jgi:hypothetical protein
LVARGHGDVAVFAACVRVSVFFVVACRALVKNASNGRNTGTAAAPAHATALLAASVHPLINNHLVALGVFADHEGLAGLHANLHDARIAEL